MVTAKQSFYRILTEAIRDVMIHGFDSQKRLEQWTQKLEVAARAALVPRSVLERSVRDALLRVFERTTKQSQLLKRHKGISFFTLESIKPKLRAELDRRILASASLIKLNREASVQRTLQRFQGWATSIPIGGSDTADAREAAVTVRKGIAALPFEERRVIIDQGHKLTSAINDIVATDGGAIAATWHHVNESGGYQARIKHEERDGLVFVVRNNWALAKGYMKLAGRQYTDEIEAPGEFVFCRCSYSYIYNLRDLPAEMITAAGKAELARIRAIITRYHNG